MKWNQLKDKTKVRLLVDLRVINTKRVTQYAYVTPAELDEIAPITQHRGTTYTVYVNDTQVELFDEATDNVMFVAPDAEIPCHFIAL